VSDRWGLFHRPPLGRWTKGRVTLLGDAAHAMAPHHGQGANQSIEDAVVLAACLGDTWDRGSGIRDPGSSGWLIDATSRYEQLRRGRTRKVQYASISTADMLGSFEEALHHLGWVHEFDAGSQEPSERQGGTWL
jgi:salicylate hydroxylase